jgi:hypothetical protein
MENEKRSATFPIRLKPSIKKAAEEAARADNRSLSSLIETLLLQHLEAKGLLPKGAAE